MGVRLWHIQVYSWREKVIRPACKVQVCLNLRCVTEFKDFLLTIELQVASTCVEKLDYNSLMSSTGVLYETEI